MNNNIEETIISSARTGGDEDKITTAQIDKETIK